MFQSLPVNAFHFKVDFIFPLPSKSLDARFESIEGIGKSIVSNKKTDAQGVQNSVTNSSAVELEKGQLTLKRGLIPGSFLIDWFEMNITLKKRIPIPIVVSALDANHTPIYSWFFYNAYPIKWETGGFNAMSGKYITETIVIQYDWYKQVNMQTGIFSAVASAALGASNYVADAGSKVAQKGVNAAKSGVDSATNTVKDALD
jgi:phage tail-like protein